MPTRTFSFIFNGGDSIAKAFTVTAAGEASMDQVVAASASNFAVTLALIIAKLKSLFLVSDQAITIKLNSSSEPPNTFVLAPNVPVIWSIYGTALIDSNGTVLATDITELFFTNAGEVDANFSLRAQFDPTV